MSDRIDDAAIEKLLNVEMYLAPGPWSAHVYAGHRNVIRVYDQAREEWPTPMLITGSTSASGGDTFHDQAPDAATMRFLAQARNAVRPIVERLRDAEKRAEEAEGLLRDMATDGLPVADVRNLRAALRTLATAVGLMTGDISKGRIDDIIDNAMSDAKIVTMSSGSVTSKTFTSWNANPPNTPPAAG